MSKPLTQSIQDYLKYIYELNDHGEAASTNDLAARLGIAPPSVTGMLRRLSSAKPALVVYKKHQGVTLTKAGEKAALEVIRRHRLLETWLVQTLGYAWDEVHEEAERLEHVISENFEERIAAAMGNPLRDPHGELIPTADLKMPLDDSTPLASLRAGQSGTITCIRAADTGLLRHLENLGLTPGTQIKIEEFSPFDHNLTVRANNKTLVLGPNITSRILIKTAIDKDFSIEDLDK